MSSAADRLKRRLKLRDLDTLMAVVNAGGMRKAAEALHMSQSAVSKSIADLEDVIGVRLLDRTTRGVEPTKYGEALLRRGRVIFDELQQVRARSAISRSRAWASCASARAKAWRRASCRR